MREENADNYPAKMLFKKVAHSVCSVEGEPARVIVKLSVIVVLEKDCFLYFVYRGTTVSFNTDIKVSAMEITETCFMISAYGHYIAYMSEIYELQESYLILPHCDRWCSSVSSLTKEIYTYRNSRPI